MVQINQTRVMKNRTPPVAASGLREKSSKYKDRRKELKQRKIKTVNAFSHAKGFHHKSGSFHQGKIICFFEKCDSFLFLLVQFAQ